MKQEEKKTKSKQRFMRVIPNSWNQRYHTSVVNISIICILYSCDALDSRAVKVLPLKSKLPLCKWWIALCTTGITVCIKEKHTASSLGWYFHVIFSDLMYQHVEFKLKHNDWIFNIYSVSNFFFYFNCSITTMCKKAQKMFRRIAKFLSRLVQFPRKKRKCNFCSKFSFFLNPFNCQLWCSNL